MQVSSMIYLISVLSNEKYLFGITTKLVFSDKIVISLALIHFWNDLRLSTQTQ